MLVVALTPLIQFYSQTFSFGIGIIQFELTALGLLIFHLGLNNEVLRDTLDFFKTSETEKEENNERKIESFQRKFASKDKTELEKIVDENFLVPEAVEAARRLLKEK